MKTQEDIIVDAQKDWRRLLLKYGSIVISPRVPKAESQKIKKERRKVRKEKPNFHKDEKGHFKRTFQSLSPSGKNVILNMKKV
ncbi:hypothetical protein TSMEX_005066 [Taenia solium]|eukprot:TsM_000897400 transcript=TsM_000897400 gene=TsM_000897400